MKLELDRTENGQLMLRIKGDTDVYDSVLLVDMLGKELKDKHLYVKSVKDGVLELVTKEICNQNHYPYDMWRPLYPYYTMDVGSDTNEYDLTVEVGDKPESILNDVTSGHVTFSIGDSDSVGLCSGGYVADSTIANLDYSGTAIPQHEMEGFMCYHDNPDSDLELMKKMIEPNSTTDATNDNDVIVGEPEQMKVRLNFSGSSKIKMLKDLLNSLHNDDEQSEAYKVVQDYWGIPDDDFNLCDECPHVLELETLKNDIEVEKAVAEIEDKVRSTILNSDIPPYFAENMKEIEKRGMERKLKEIMKKSKSKNGLNPDVCFKKGEKIEERLGGNE